ncbi:LppU/SCO3897 family protein [Lentzea sp. E54]|uniref:LppU/SCO3897 family protein n=1 Tax=Lentzea xerophila TaxID=3435883 RepID=UPI003DA2C925
MVVRQTVMVCVLAVVAYLAVWWAFSDTEPTPAAPASMFLTDYSKAGEGSCVKFDGPGENDLGLTVVDCNGDRAALKVGTVLSNTNGECPRGEYKVLRDTRHNAALCLLPNAERGDCFELDTDDLQRSVVSKFDCASPRVNVQVVDVVEGSCPEEAELGVPYEETTLCLRRVR